MTFTGEPKMLDKVERRKVKCVATTKDLRWSNEGRELSPLASDHPPPTRHLAKFHNGNLLMGFFLKVKAENSPASY